MCSDHFISGKPSLLYDSNNPDWVPSQNLGYGQACGDTTRYERVTSRHMKRKELQEKEESEPKRNRVDASQTESQESESGTAVQTNFTYHNIDDVELEINKLRGEVETLCKSKERDNLSMDAFQFSDSVYILHWPTKLGSSFSGVRVFRK